MPEESQSNSSAKFLNSLEKDTLIEAKDSYGIWYPAKVIAVKDGKVRVHFCRWSSRYDTWYPLTSDDLRPLQEMTPGPSVKPTQPNPARMPPQASGKSFQPGSYVMALWRNQFEYLAEVLAYRCRQNEKPEYRIRFIWDNVIEWTAVQKLRKATQFEIDYVLKFCREHGGPGSGRPVSAAKTVAQSPASNEVTNGTSLTHRSHSRRRNSVGNTNSPATSIDHAVTPPSLKSTSIHHSSISVEQDDMVYDKSVFQFHEACRKRRELKRQAAVAQVGSPTTGSTPKTNGSAGHTSPVEVQTQPTVKIACVSDTLESPASLGSKVSNSSMEVDPSGPGSIKRSPKSVPSKPRSFFHASPKEISTKPSSFKLDNSKSGPSTPPAPVNYPCPFCPRILRHSKLLAAHLANYHKDAQHPDKKKSPRPTPRSPVISKVECSEFSVPKSPSKSEQVRPSSPTILLTCHPCGSHRILVGTTNDLAQCENCLCWVHKDCYSRIVDEPRPFNCDGCLFHTRRPARSSRLGEASLSALRDTSRDGPQQFIPQLTELVNWSNRLQPLVNTGWVVLQNTRLPESSPKKTTVSPTGGGTTKIPVSTNHSGSLSQPDRSNNDEQLNRLYMEFRNSVVNTSQGSQPRPIPEDDPSFASESSACWPLAEDPDVVDPSAITANLISNQVLTGFLQDLGPNVISELVDLGAEPAVGENADMEEFFDRPKQSEDDRGTPVDNHTPDFLSAKETPTKGLGPLLTSPTGVATLLQATISNSFSVPNSAAIPFANPAIPLNHPSREPAPYADAPIQSPCLDTKQSSSERLSTILPAASSSTTPQNHVFEASIPDALEPLPSTSLPSSLPPADLVPSIDNDTHEANQEQSEHPVSSGDSLGSGSLEWLPLSKSASTKVPQTPTYDGIAFHPALLKSDPLPTTAVSSMMHDASFGLDTFMNDVITPDVLQEAHSNLDYLDEHILNPLERALCIMESQLDIVTEQLAVLDQQDRFNNPSRGKNHNGTESLFSTGSSPFASSSSSFSLSPAAHSEPPVTMDTVFPSTSITIDFMKQTAQRLFRQTMLDKSSQPH